MASDDAVDRLYGLPPGSFVPERDALARALRGDRRRDDAAAVKALAKPTVAAWAVNQVVRSQGRDARALWSAGDALAGAQAAVVAGKGSGSDLRAAAEAERAAVETLVDAARGLLDDRGHGLSETTLERVRSTLHAAAIDPEAREAVAAGRAEHELEPPALGGFAGAAAAPAPARAGKRRGEADRDREREAAAEARRVERERRALRRRVEQAQAALEKARADAERAQERLDAAREREAEASDVLDEARAALDGL
jgi:hypothetical protein